VQFCDGRDPSHYTGDTATLIDRVVEADAVRWVCAFVPAVSAGR